MRTNWLLWLILGVAFALRLAGSKANLPYLYNPGESIIVRQALAYGTGTLRPYSFIYPPLYSYLLFLLYGLYFLIGKLLGSFPTVADFALSYFMDATPFYWIGRLLTALMGGATVGLTYCVASRAYGRRCSATERSGAAAREGLLAAAFLAVSHLHVVHSHYVLTDVPMTFLVMLVMWLILRAEARGTMASWALAGGAVGVAAAMKYNAGLIAITLVVALLLRTRKRSRSQSALVVGALAPSERAEARTTNPGKLSVKEAGLLLAVSFICALFGFILACPYALLDFRALWTDLMVVQGGLNRGIARPFGEALLFYLQTLLRSGLARLLGVFSLCGLGYVLWRRREEDILLLSFPVAYLLFLCVQGRYQPNWLLPALPFFCIFAAALVVALGRTRAGAVRPWRQDLFITLVALILAFYPAWYSFFYVKSICQKDTRTLAKEWIEQHVPSGARILLDSSSTGPPLQPTVASLQRYLANAEEDKEISSRPEAAQNAFASYRRYQLQAAEQYAQRGITYDLDYMQLAWWRAEEDEPDLSEFPVFGAYRERIFSDGRTSPAQQLREAGFDYVVASSFKYRQYLSPEGEAKWPSYASFYRSLDQEARLIQRFSADPIHQPGPDIKIYALNLPESSSGVLYRQLSGRFSLKGTP